MHCGCLQRTGGAIHIAGDGQGESELLIDSCNFASNKARKCEFSGCGRGGAIRLVDSSSFYASSSTFSDNKAVFL